MAPHSTALAFTSNESKSRRVSCSHVTQSLEIRKALFKSVGWTSPLMKDIHLKLCLCQGTCHGNRHTEQPLRWRPIMPELSTSPGHEAHDPLGSLPAEVEVWQKIWGRDMASRHERCFQLPLGERSPPFFQEGSENLASSQTHPTLLSTTSNRISHSGLSLERLYSYKFTCCSDGGQPEEREVSSQVANAWQLFVPYPFLP